MGDPVPLSSNNIGSSASYSFESFMRMLGLCRGEFRRSLLFELRPVLKIYHK